MVSVVSLQAVVVLLGAVAVLNLVVLALVLGQRRRVADAEEAIEEQVETVAGTLEAGLADEVGRIEGSVAGLPDDVEDVQEDVTMLTERLPEVERALARLDGRLDGFSEGGLTAIEDRLETAQATLAGIADDLAAVDTAVGETDERVAALEAAVTQLDQSVERALEATEGGASGLAADDLAAIERRLAALEELLYDHQSDASGEAGGEPDEMADWISGADAGANGAPGDTERDVTAETAGEEELWADSQGEAGGTEDVDPADDETGSGSAEDAPDEGGFDLEGTDEPSSESGDGGGESR